MESAHSASSTAKGSWSVRVVTAMMCLVLVGCSGDPWAAGRPGVVVGVDIDAGITAFDARSVPGTGRLIARFVDLGGPEVYLYDAVAHSRNGVELVVHCVGFDGTVSGSQCGDDPVRNWELPRVSMDVSARDSFLIALLPDDVVSLRVEFGAESVEAEIRNGVGFVRWEGSGLPDRIVATNEEGIETDAANPAR